MRLLRSGGGHRGPAGVFPAVGRDGRLGQRLPDHEPGVRGRAAARVRGDAGARAHLPRPAARVLVALQRHRPGGGGARVPRGPRQVTVQSSAVQSGPVHATPVHSASLHSSVTPCSP
eukprot:660083-Prorocentrum_minimum.AAC.4